MQCFSEWRGWVLHSSVNVWCSLWHAAFSALPAVYDGLVDWWLCPDAGVSRTRVFRGHQNECRNRFCVDWVFRTFIMSRFYFMVCLRDIDRVRQSIFSPEAKLSYSWVKCRVPVYRVQSWVSEFGGTTSDSQHYHAGIQSYSKQASTFSANCLVRVLTHNC